MTTFDNSKNINTAKITTQGGDVKFGDTIINISKSADYKEIQERIEELQDLCNLTSDEEKKLSYIKKLDSLIELRISFEREVIELAELIESKINSITNNRLNKAINYIKDGNFKEARNLLNTEDLNKEQLYLLEEQERTQKKALEVSEKLHQSAEEFLLLAKLSELDYNDENRYETTKGNYEKSLKSEENIINLSEFALFLQENRHFIEAIPLYEKAYALCKERVKEKNVDIIYIAVFASITNNIANIKRERNMFSEAYDYYIEALNACDIYLKENTEPLTLLHKVVVLNNIGVLLHLQNRYEDAEGFFLKALEIANAYESKEYQYNKAMIYSNLSYIYRKRNKIYKADTYSKKAIDINKLLVKNNPQNLNYSFDLAKKLNSLASLNRSKNNVDEAEITQKECLSIMEELVLKNPYKHLSDFADFKNNMANILIDKQQLKEALLIQEEALQINRELVKIDPQAHEPKLATTLHNMSNTYFYNNEFEEALKLNEEALEIRRKLNKLEPNAFSNNIADTLYNQGAIKAILNDYIGSEKCFIEALNIYKLLSKDNPDTYLQEVAITQLDLVSLYLRDKKMKSINEILNLIKSAISILELEPFVSTPYLNDHLLNAKRKYHYYNSSIK